MPHDFDIAAKNYDTDFTYSKIGKAQRDCVHHYFNQKTLQNKKLNILELNCGTGEDAYFFSEKGHDVIATDISSAMIDIAKSKYEESTIRFQQQDITKIFQNTFNEKFDLIFSNFGGLNCLSKEDLNTFIKISPSLLNPSGKMVLVIMPKNSLWERFYFILKGKFKTAFRRNTNKKVLANVDGVQVSTWYYNPNEVISLANNKYQVLEIKPIGLSIPPSYLESFFKNKKRILNLLIRLEKVFSSRFWAKYADHYLIEFKKK